MENCRYHPDREAVAACNRCGAPICEECIAPGSDPPLCMDCSIAAEGERLQQKMPPSEAAPPPPTARPAIGRAGRAMLVLGLLIIAVEVGIILLMRPTSAPAAGAQGTSVTAEQQATAQAAGDLIILRSALEAYKKEHGTYPASLDEIMDQLPEPLQSSLKAKAIVYSMDNTGNYRIRYTSGSPQPLVLERSRNAIVVEEVTQ